jgi:hypothetical protein
MEEFSLGTALDTRTGVGAEGGGRTARGVKSLSIEVEVCGAVVRIARTVEVRLVRAVIEALKVTR